MNRVLRTLILLAALGLAAGGPVPAQSSPGQVTTNLILPFDGVRFGNGELIQFTGYVHLNIQAVPPSPITPPSPVIPPSPIRIHANLLDAQGVGLTSGMVWRAVGVAEFAFSQPPPNTYLFSAFYSLVPPNPVTPPNPILPLQLEFGVSVNADGSVDTASVLVSGNSFDGPP